MTDESRFDLDQEIEHDGWLEYVAKQILLDCPLCPHCGEELAGVDYKMVYEHGVTKMMCICGEVGDEWEEE